MIFVEYLKDNYNHLEINSAQIAYALQTAENQNINLFAGIEHYNLILKKLQSNDIDTSKLIFHRIEPLSKKFWEYQFLLFQYNLIKDIYKFARENDEKVIIFLSTTTIMAFLVEVFCYIYRFITVVVCLHGNLERIELLDYAKKSNNNFIQVLLYSLIFGMQNPLRMPLPQNLKFLVFNKYIKQHLLTKIPKLNKNLICFLHPFLYDKENNTNETLNNEKVTFSIVGITSFNKNWEELSKLLEYINNNCPDKVEFSFAGFIRQMEIFQILSGYNFINKKKLSTSMLSMREKNDIIRNSHYTILTYQTDCYKYTASGAILDAINNEKPIIAINNASLQQYFEDYGNIGYLCSSYEEFKTKVISVINDFPNEEYQEQIKNLKLLKEKCNVKTQSIEYKKLLTE